MYNNEKAKNTTLKLHNNTVLFVSNNFKNTKFAIDEEVAEVVSRMFQLVIEDKGVCQIARILSQDKVLTASAHWK